MREELIGKIGVDSGSVMICDPCYVIKDENWTGEFYNQWGERNAAEVILPGDGFPSAICGSTRDGDGCYPVYAKYDDNNRLISYEVRFVEENEKEE